MISIIIDSKLSRFHKEMKYVFSFIFKSLGYHFQFITNWEELKANDIFIFYGLTELTPEEIKVLAKRNITFFIPCDFEFYDPKAYTADKLRRCLREHKLLSITPVISARKFENIAENYSESDVNGGKFNFDLVGNIFLHLSNLEERTDAQAMDKGIYPDEASAFYNFKDIPIVDNLLWLMDSMIKEHCRAKKSFIAQKMFWPDAQQAAVLLSHSIDDLQKWDLSSLVLSLADDLAMFFSFKWKQLGHNLAGKLKFIFTNYELYWNFEEFRKLERESGCRSTYYLATEPCEEIDYSLEDPDLQEEIQQILREGNDIGLMTTGDKLNRDDYLTRKQILLHQLGKEQIGIRQCGFRSNETTRDLQNKISPSYSQSSSFQNVPGFKNGISLPWYPWISGNKAEFVELPTEYRDNHLKLTKHKLVQLEDAKHQIKKFYHQATRSHGIFSVDFSIASYSDIHYCNKLYAYILALVKSGNNYLATAAELAAWWEKRGRITIDEGEYEISVFFPDDIDSFVLSVHGDPKILEIDGISAKIEGNTIRFNNVKAESIAVIRLNKNA
ncbi:MAG: hypothetical protein M0P99_06155 [Candidatus Cloacimonetes bacterium]|nr:hypothetical protein [Candidatus Cloacimonadota bacterium]